MSAASELETLIEGAFKATRLGDAYCPWCKLGDLDLHAPSHGHADDCLLVLVAAAARKLIEEQRISYPMTPVDVLLSSLSELELALPDETVVSVKEHVRRAAAECRQELRAPALLDSEQAELRAADAAALRDWPWSDAVVVTDQGDHYFVEAVDERSRTFFGISRIDGHIVRAGLDLSYER